MWKCYDNWNDTHALGPQRFIKTSMYLLERVIVKSSLNNKIVLRGWFSEQNMKLGELLRLCIYLQVCLSCHVSFENKLESTLSTCVASTTSLQFISYSQMQVLYTSWKQALFLQYVDPFSASKRVSHTIVWKQNFCKHFPNINPLTALSVL